MSEILVKPYEHRKGFHCGTSSVRALMSHFGFELSEPMCLGLGMGLNLFDFEAEESSPTRLFLGRNPTLEEDFFINLGVDAPVRRHRDPAKAWDPVEAMIDAGRPVMLQVDICRLPYFRTKVHFGGHKVVLVGHDPESRTALLSDSEFPEIQQVTLEELSMARWDPTPPWDLQCQWWDLREVPGIAPLAEAVPRAITGAALRVARDPTGLFGIKSMRRLAEGLPSWAEAKDWSWCARFGYQVIERRGTGGGSFRAKYADFLDEAKPFDARIERLDLAERMRRIAGLWSDFAMLLKAVSERSAPSGFGEAARIFEEITDGEEEFFEDILKNS